MPHQQSYRGVVHGTSVELSPAPNLPDGFEVDVTIRELRLTPEEKKRRLESLFGSCMDDAESLDRFLEWNHGQRKHNRNSVEP